MTSVLALGLVRAVVVLAPLTPVPPAPPPEPAPREHAAPLPLGRPMGKLFQATGDYVDSVRELVRRRDARDAAIVVMTREAMEHLADAVEQLPGEDSAERAAAIRNDAGRMDPDRPFFLVGSAKRALGAASDALTGAAAALDPAPAHMEGHLADLRARVDRLDPNTPLSNERIAMIAALIDANDALVALVEAMRSPATRVASGG